VTLKNLVDRDFKLGNYRLMVASANPRMANHPWKGRVYVTWTI